VLTAKAPRKLQKLNRKGAEAQRDAKENKSKTKSEILKFFAVLLCAFAPLRLLPFSALPLRPLCLCGYRFCLSWRSWRLGD
jgi:hypothetical protein